MLFLRCLGSLGLVDNENMGPSAGQVRRLALLAVLAAHRDRPVSRDALVALLWPESDENRARQALSQSLYALRRDLQCETLFLGQRDLTLNPAVIDCDLWQFQAAIQRDALEEGVALYRGDFLDGVHISQAERFERWTDEQRDRVRQQMHDALERLASAASEAGQHDRAVSWWSRRATTDALSHRVALRVAQAMVAAGDRAAALQYIARHEDVVRQELDVGLDPTLLQLCSELTTPPPHAPATASKRTNEPERPQVATPKVAEVAPVTDPTATPATQARHAKPWRLLIAPAVIAAVIALIAMARRQSNQAVRATPETTRVVAIGALEFAGPPGDAFKAKIVERLLLANLASIPRLRIAQGDEPDTSLVISGSVVANSSNGSIVAIARLAAKGGTPVQLRAADAQGDLSAVTDNLTRQVIAQLANAEDVSALLASASTTTRSLEALRFFAAGEEQFEAGRWKEAEDAFAQAVRADSTFALASYRLSEAANWNGNVTTQQQAAERAWRMRAGLPTRDRILVEANWAWNSGDVDAAERGFRDAVTRYPWDGEAWYQLGEVLFHSGPVMGRPAQLAIDAYVRAARPVAGGRVRRRAEALLHLERIAALTGDTIAFDSLRTQLQSMASADDVLELNALAACARRTPQALRELDRILRVANGNAVLSNARRCALFGASLRFALSVYAAVPTSALDPTLALGARVEESALRTSLADDTLAAQLLARPLGRLPATALLLHRALRAVQQPATPAAQLRAYRDSLVGGWPRDLAPGVERRDADYGFLSNRFGPFVAGLIDARLGDTASVWAQVRRLRSLDSDTATQRAGANMAHTLLARLAIDGRQPQRAIAHLDSLLPIAVVSQLDYANERGHARLFRAEALQQLGQFTESASVAQSIGQRSVFEYLLVADAIRLATTSLERAGLRDSASALTRRWAQRRG